MTCQDNVWYAHTSMLNMCQISSLMTAAEGLVAEFSSFANFEENKRNSNLLRSFPKIDNQMGSFGQIRKISLFRFCRLILDIFGFTLSRVNFSNCQVWDGRSRKIDFSLLWSTNSPYVDMKRDILFLASKRFKF